MLRRKKPQSCCQIHYFKDISLLLGDLQWKVEGGMREKRLTCCRVYQVELDSQEVDCLYSLARSIKAVFKAIQDFV